MRLSLGKKVFRLKRLLFLLIFIGLMISIMHWIVNTLSSEDNVSPMCETTPEIKVKMVDLLSRITNILESMNISYFLCYNSLWGALKVNGPLKWDSNLDICLLNEQISNYEEAFLIKSFKRQKMHLSYQASDGIYLVNLQSDGEMPSAKLYLFEEDVSVNKYRRVGWKNRLIPLNSCELVHCFPASLIATPLPKEKFMNFDVPIPRESVEIQKYLFPNNWWEEIGPKNCRQDDEN